MIAINIWTLYSVKSNNTVFVMLGNPENKVNSESQL